MRGPMNIAARYDGGHPSLREPMGKVSGVWVRLDSDAISVRKGTRLRPAEVLRIPRSEIRSVTFTGEAPDEAVAKARSPWEGVKTFGAYTLFVLSLGLAALIGRALVGKAVGDKARVIVAGDTEGLAWETAFDFNVLGNVTPVRIARRFYLALAQA
jgi:hypothetical protein